MLKSFFDRVSDIVTNNRSNDYGDPLLNHMRIANLWNVWLNNRTWGPEITPYDVSMMMNLVKFARCLETPSHENHVDIAGYAAVSEKIFDDLIKTGNLRSPVFPTGHPETTEEHENGGEKTSSTQAP